MTEPKEIKKEIRALKKLKLQCQPGSKERIDLHRKIKDLKKQLTEVTRPEPQKDPIIKEILEIYTEHKITPRFEDIGIDLHKYTLKELEKHLEILKRKTGLDR